MTYSRPKTILPPPPSPDQRALVSLPALPAFDAQKNEHACARTTLRERPKDLRSSFLGNRGI